MKLEHCQYILALNQAGSINKASRLLHTSPQNVSRVMAQFEQELNVKLFSRTPQGIDFTSAGKGAIDLAKEIMDAIENYKRTLPAQTEALHGNIRIVSTKVQSAYFLNNALLSFSEIYPNIRIDYIEADLFQGIRLLEEKKATIGVLQQLEAEDFSSIPDHLTDRFTWIPLSDDNVQILVKKGSSLSKRKVVKMRTLSNYPLVIYVRNDFRDSFWREIIDHYFYEKASIFVASNSYLFYSKIIKENYVGLGTERASRSSDGLQNEAIRSQVSFIPLEDNFQFNNCLVIPKCDAMPMVVKCFVDFLMSYCQRIG